eukprot:GEZU01039508.1.p1 GENE.GEZU01039508.1~~GEZU01039508.1.p1  ORF type:complete len:254 (-),score=77.64 GEZU01039508.1:119-781(-)
MSLRRVLRVGRMPTFRELDRIMENEMRRLMQPLQLLSRDVMNEGWEDISVQQGQQQQKQIEGCTEEQKDQQQQEENAPALMSNFNFSRLLDPFAFTPSIRGRTGFAWAPRVDVSDANDKIVVKAEVPGLKKDDINVEITGSGPNRKLMISGESKQEKKDEKENFIRMERRYGKFMRSFALPPDVKPEDIKANLDHGILQVEIKKPPTLMEPEEKQKIQIE